MVDPLPSNNLTGLAVALYVELAAIPLGTKVTIFLVESIVTVPLIMDPSDIFLTTK